MTAEEAAREWFEAWFARPQDDLVQGLTSLILARERAARVEGEQGILSRLDAATRDSVLGGIEQERLADRAKAEEERT